MSKPLQKALLWGGAIAVALIASYFGLDIEMISGLVQEINQ